MRTMEPEDLACASCGQLKGYPCVTASGRTAQEPHASRLLAAITQGEIIVTVFRDGTAQVEWPDAEQERFDLTAEEASRVADEWIFQLAEAAATGGDLESHG